MGGLRVSVGKHGCEIKCPHCIFEVLFSTEGDAFRGVAREGGLNADRLCHHESQDVTFLRKESVYLTISASRSA